MSLRLLGALGVILLGAVLGVPVVAVLGIVVVMLEVAHAIWARRGLRGVRYRRHLATHRMAWGDKIDLDVEVWNRKRLPLAWLRADDAISPGLAVEGQRSIETELFGPTLRNSWTLAPFERVVRHLAVSAERRGVFTIGPVDVSVGDLFARQAAATELPDLDTITVWPRTVASASVVR